MNFIKKLIMPSKNADDVYIPSNHHISDLKPGQYYVVDLNGVMYYAKADGTLSATLSDIALLEVTEITGLTNNKKYKVAGSAQYPVAYSNLSNDDQIMLDKVNALADNEFENHFQPDNGNLNLTGIAVGIIKNGKIFFINRGYHESDQDGIENKTSITENSVFEIASMTKIYTGILLSYLSDAINPSTNKPYINLYDTVDMYFDTEPYVPSKGGKPIYPTLAQLASHSSGFPRTPNNWDKSNIDGGEKYENYHLEHMILELKNMVYDFEPGTKSEYSNFAVAVLGNILAKVYYGPSFPSKGYENLLQELVCEPLYIESTITAPWLNADVQSRKTLPHGCDGVPKNEWHFDAFAPAGGINSTTSNVILWLAMQMGEYVPPAAIGLHNAVAKTCIAQIQCDNGFSYAGLNWYIQPNKAVLVGALSPYENNADSLGDIFARLFPALPNEGQRYGQIYYHTGLVGGYNGEFIMCPATKTAVVVLMNNGDTNENANMLTAQILSRVLNSDATGANKVTLAYC